MKEEVVIRKYSNMVYRIAYSMTRTKADAEDIYQEVFIKYFSKNVIFNDEEHEKRWLIRVTMNECKMLHRKNFFKREVELDENVSIPCDDSYTTPMIVYVKKLPQKYRNVIYLYYYEGYKIEEIANILETTSGTVKSQLSRAKQKLKELIGDDFGE